MTCVNLTLLMMALTAPMFGQLAGKVDLARKGDSTVPSNATTEQVPKNCKSPSFSVEDGIVVGSEEPAKLMLTVLPSKVPTLKVGQDLTIEISLKNIGSHTVKIPWSTDDSLIRPSDDSTHNEYEEGWFEAELDGQQNVRVPLESESAALFSSEKKPKSALELVPGQWIAATFKFKVEEKRISSVWMPLPSGKTQIKINWRQSRHTWDHHGCKFVSGYYSYAYQIDSRPINITISNTTN